MSDAREPADAQPEWFGAIVDEIRRVGRAAIAARASAEACEESVERLAALERGAGAATNRPGEADPTSLLRSLLPVFDAIGRMAATQAGLSSPRGWVERLRFAQRTETELRALREAVVLLHEQLEAVLEGQGVRIDRGTGASVDPDVHRVVDTVPRGTRAGATVVRVVRPGYRWGGVLVRETDVVATGEG